MPRVPPVTLPGLPATPGVPGLTEGVPEEVPGAVVVPVCVPTDDGFVPVAPGCVVVVVPGDVVLDVPVCVPMPGLGVTDPVV